MKKDHPHPSYTVEVEHNGTRHQAEYTVANGVVSVTYGKVTNPGLRPNLPADHVARELLLEILEGNKWRF